LRLANVHQGQAVERAGRGRVAGLQDADDREADLTGGNRERQHVAGRKRALICEARPDQDATWRGVERAEVRPRLSAAQGVAEGRLGTQIDPKDAHRLPVQGRRDPDAFHDRR